MTENTYDTIIIGGGPGGLSAGIYAKRAALNVLLIEKGVLGGQIVNSDEVENYLGFENIGGAELSMKFGQHAHTYDLDIVSQEVAEIIPGADFHTVKLANGDTYRTCSIIMAMGGNPKKLDIPGESEYYGKGVSYCAVCDGFFFRDKTVMVIGGGDTAAEEALYLSNICSKVHLVHRREELRAEKILQDRLHARENIVPVWNHTLEEVLGDDMGVKANSSHDGKVPVVDPGGIDTAGIAARNHLAGQIDVRRNTQFRGQQVRGSKRNDTQRRVAHGQTIDNFIDCPVTAGRNNHIILVQYRKGAALPYAFAIYPQLVVIICRYEDFCSLALCCSPLRLPPDLVDLTHIDLAGRYTCIKIGHNKRYSLNLAVHHNRFIKLIPGH